MDPYPSSAPRPPPTRLHHDIATPTSHYLNHRLEECRAQAKRSRRSDFGPSSRPPAPDDDIFIAEAEADAARRPYLRQLDGSPTAHEAFLRRSNSGHASDTPPGSVSASTRKRIGVREADEQMARLSKLNFDLKMEVFHRRQREEALQEQVTALEARLAGAQKLAEENDELMIINDKLVKELEKRDGAVREAVELICELETKTEGLSAPVSHTKALPMLQKVDEGWDHDVLNVIPPSSPLEQRTPAMARMKRSPTRLPSFMIERKESTQTLREVYLDPTKTLRPVQSFVSLLSRRDSRTEDGNGADHDLLNSPRLSVLSESSFPSIYDHSPKKPVCGTPDAHQVDNVGDFALEQEPMLRTNGSFDTSITRVNHWMNAKDAIANVRDRAKSPLMGASVFAESRMPPTPDSMSTRMLRDSQSSVFGSVAVSDHGVQTATLRPRPEQAMKHSLGPGLTCQPATHTTNGRGEPFSTDDTKTFQDIGLVYDEDDDYPNGGSIATGTPSRFQIRHTSPPAANMLFNGDGINAIRQNRAPTTAKRRKSSAEVYLVHSSHSVRPDLNRAETSPATHKPSTSTSPSAATPTSAQAPASNHSNSGGGILAAASTRTHVAQQPLSNATTGASAADTAATPAVGRIGPSATPPTGLRSSLTQRTAKLFARRKSCGGPSAAAAEDAHEVAPGVVGANAARPRATASSSLRLVSPRQSPMSASRLQRSQLSSASAVAPPAAATPFARSGHRRARHSIAHAPLQQPPSGTAGRPRALPPSSSSLQTATTAATAAVTAQAAAKEAVHRRYAGGGGGGGVGGVGSMHSLARDAASSPVAVVSPTTAFASASASGKRTATARTRAGRMSLDFGRGGRGGSGAEALPRRESSGFAGLVKRVDSARGVVEGVRRS